jgi:hypothetical protein
MKTIDNYKKQKDATLLDFIKENRETSMYDCSDVEIKNFISIRHECKRRKIGPFQINLALAREW